MSARAICGDMTRRLEQMPPPKGKPSAADVARVVGVWGSAVRRLRALDPPRRDAKRIDAMLDHWERAIVAARAIPKTEGEEVLGPIAAFAFEGAKGAEIAKRYGLLKCSLAAPPPERPPADEESLEAAARGLVPAGANALETRDRPCSEDETGPSPCSVMVAIDFAGLDLASRIERTKRRAAESGWRAKSTSRFAGHAVILLSRNDYEASIELKPDTGGPGCGTDRTPRICTDSVTVSRWQTPFDD